MKLTSCFDNFYGVLELEKIIDIFSEVGFYGIDLSMNLKKCYTIDDEEKFYKNAKKHADDKGMVITQTHAPFPSSFMSEEKTQQRFEEIVKSMKYSSLLGAQFIVVHPCQHTDPYVENNYEIMMEYNYNFYKKLVPYAESYEIKIATENIRNYITVTPEGAKELIDLLDNDVFTMCLDTGHSNMVGQDVAEIVRKLGSYIGCTHIHDNDGEHDSHILPYHGTANWENVMKAFAEIGYSGNLNFEAGSFVKDLPVELKADAAKYMASVGKHLIERYNYYKDSK